MIVESFKDIFPLRELPTGEGVYGPFFIQGKDISKVRSTVKQLYRDWSAEGKSERDQCYLPIVSEIEKHFPNPSADNKVTVLCPGSGLARLPFDLACMGYSAQGNEFSYYMLLTSNIILNEVTFWITTSHLIEKRPRTRSFMKSNRLSIHFRTMLIRRHRSKAIRSLTFPRQPTSNPGRSFQWYQGNSLWCIRTSRKHGTVWPHVSS